MNVCIDGFVLPLPKNRLGDDQVMADPRIQARCPAEGQPAPFDCRRMAYGGFRTLVTR